MSLSRSSSPLFELVSLPPPPLFLLYQLDVRLILGSSGPSKVEKGLKPFEEANKVLVRFFVFFSVTRLPLTPQFGSGQIRSSTRSGSSSRSIRKRLHLHPREERWRNPPGPSSSHSTKQVRDFAPLSFLSLSENIALTMRASFFPLSQRLPPLVHSHRSLPR